MILELSLDLQGDSELNMGAVISEVVKTKRILHMIAFPSSNDLHKSNDPLLWKVKEFKSTLVYQIEVQACLFFLKKKTL